MKIKKLLALVVVLVVVGVLVVLLKDKFETYRLYTNTSLKFSLLYPKLWFIQELGNDAVTAPGIYFSPQKTDFNDPYPKQTPDFVRISVRPVEEWVDRPENKRRVYTDAKDLLDTVWQEERQGPAPHIPGPPRFKAFAQGFAVPGAIEVESIQTAYYEPNAHQYWIAHKDKLYEFLVLSTETPQIQQMLTSFQFIQ